MLLSLFAGEGIFLEVFNCRCGIGRRRERSRKGKRELSGDEETGMVEVNVSKNGTTRVY